MAAVAIVSDSTHYLPASLLEAYGIRDVSLYFNWGDGPEKESDLSDYDGFYERLRTGSETPSTSQPSIGDFLAVYDPLLAAGHDIVSVHVSGGISGTSSAAAQAADVVAERDGPGRVFVLDARTAAGGLGGVVLAAAAAARAGAGVQATLARAEEARDTLAIWFCLNTLEFLARGGRIGKAQAWLGGALQVKPIMSLVGEITPIERVRTSARAFERMVDYLGFLRRDGSDGWIIQHIQAPEQAERLVARGREVFGCEPLFVSEVGPVLGAYAGPGMIGVGGLPARLIAD